MKLLSTTSLFLTFLMLTATAFAVSTSEELAARAKGGDAQAKFQLGSAYSGFKALDGVAYDRKRGVLLIEEAANEGLAEAQAFLGIFGLGTAKDVRVKFRYLRRAANSGHVGAKTALAQMYLSGAGTGKDPYKAASLLNEAAAQGHALAQTELGLLYEKGTGVPTDGERSVSLFRQAAIAGYIGAQFNLARVLAQGKVVPKNTPLAYAWANVAAGKASDADRQIDADYVEEAIRLRDLLKSPQLTTLEERRNAERLSAGWSAGNDLSDSVLGSSPDDITRLRCALIFSAMLKTSIDSGATTLVKSANARLRPLLPYLEKSRADPQLSALYRSIATSAADSVFSIEVRASKAIRDKNQSEFELATKSVRECDHKMANGLPLLSL